MEPHAGYGGLDDDFAEIPDEQVYRVEEKEVPGGLGVAVDVIEDGGHIHQQHGKHIIEVLGVPEKHKQGGEDHADADVEEDEPGDGVEQAKELPGKGQPVYSYKGEEDHQDEAEVDEGLHIPGEKK